MSNTYVAQSGFVKPILQELKNSGVKLDQILKRSGLNYFNLENGGNYIPLNSLYSVLEEFAKIKGSSHLLNLMADPIDLVEVSRYTQTVFSHPDLLSGLLYTCKYDRVMQSNEKIDLSIDGKNARLKLSWLDKPSQGQSLMEIFSINLVAMAVEMVAENNHLPSEIHLTGSIEPDFGLLLENNQTTKVYLNQPALTIVFPVELLMLPLNPIAENSSFSQSVSITSFTREISLLLESNGLSVIPGIKHMAAIADIPTRTLQRKLQNEGTSFSDIVEQWRFKHAVRMLNMDNIAIKDIAEHLRYNNLPAFYRAFQRWTNTTPVQFREQII